MVLELREVWRSLGDDAVRLALGLPGRVSGCHALAPQQNRPATRRPPMRVRSQVNSQCGELSTNNLEKMVEYNIIYRYGTGLKL
jgi:hypothetical protein